MQADETRPAKHIGRHRLVGLKGLFRRQNTPPVVRLERWCYLRREFWAVDSRPSIVALMNFMVIERLESFENPQIFTSSFNEMKQCLHLRLIFFLIPDLFSRWISIPLSYWSSGVTCEWPVHHYNGSCSLCALTIGEWRRWRMQRLGSLFTNRSVCSVTSALKNASIWWKTEWSICLAEWKILLILLPPIFSYLEGCEATTRQGFPGITHQQLEFMHLDCSQIGCELKPCD